MKTILILAANPKDTLRLRLDEEVREIEEGLRRSRHRDQFKITSKWAIRPKDLRRALFDEKPEIVHFCGHGQTDGIELEDEAGNAILVSPGSLAGLFDLCKETIECVVLNACYSQDQVSAISQHIAYVIGMKQGISDKAAMEFAVGFYDALGTGKTYEEAFQFGCNAIRLAGIPQHFVPMFKKKGDTEIYRSMQEIEFVNREKELQYITTIHSPQYLLISAPKGYGKSRLFESVKAKLQENSLCLHIRLSREQSYSVKDLAMLILQQIDEKISFQNEIKVITEEISGWIVTKLKIPQRNVIFFIDEAEALTEMTANALFNELIPLIIQDLKKTAANQSIKVRLICTGRYISHWERNVSKIPLKSLSLTPFAFPAVYETVEQYDSHNRFHPNYKKDFAAHLMYFTGGHPGCMATILCQDFYYPVRRLVAKEEEYYEFVLLPVIEKVKEHIPEDLTPIFLTLSVVRRFNARFLRRCLDRQLIVWAENDEYRLENRLLKTFLISKTNGFLYDDMSRRILAIHLRKTNLSHYLKVSQEAIAFYEAGLKDARSHNPVVLAIELLFQKLHYQVYAQQNEKQGFLDYVPEVLHMLIQRYAQEVLDAFIEQLQNDWEFKFLFNYLLRDEQYDDEHPFDQLCHQIRIFRRDLIKGAMYV